MRSKFRLFNLARNQRAFAIVNQPDAKLPTTMITAPATVRFGPIGRVWRSEGLRGESREGSGRWSGAPLAGAIGREGSWESRPLAPGRPKMLFWPPEEALLATRRVASGRQKRLFWRPERASSGRQKSLFRGLIGRKGTLAGPYATYWPNHTVRVI